MEKFISTTVDSDIKMGITVRIIIDKKQYEKCKKLNSYKYLLDRKLIVKALLTAPVIINALAETIDREFLIWRNIKRIAEGVSYLNFIKLLNISDKVASKILPEGVALSSLDGIGYWVANIKLNNLYIYNKYYINVFNYIFDNIKTEEELYLLDLASVIFSWVLRVAYFGNLELSRRNKDGKYKYKANELHIRLDSTYHYRGLSESIAAYILLTGLHSLLHMQNRLVSSKLGISYHNISERLILYSSRIKSAFFDYYVSKNYERIEHVVHIIDGGILLLPNMPRQGLSDNSASLESIIINYSVSGLHLDELYDKLMIKSQYTLTPLCKLFSETINNYGPLRDKCLDYWNIQSSSPRSSLIDMFYKILNQKSLVNIQNNFTQVLRGVSPIMRIKNQINYNNDIVGEIVKRLYYPTVEVAQKTFESVLNNIPNKSIRVSLNKYILHLTRSFTPFCWDGCPRCIIEETCFLSSKIIQQSIISKDAAQFICKILNNL